MADDALTCLQNLLTSVPAWISQLEAILVDTERRQTELSTHEEAAVLPRRPSRTSQRSAKSNKIAAEERLSQTGPQAVAEHLGSANLLRFVQRKRKSASVCTNGDSTPSKYRSRAVAVLYYDGDAQKQFESVVRAVGASRNAIRKGKLSIKIDSLARTGSSSSSSSSSGEETIKGLGTFSYRTTTTMRRPTATGRRDGSEAFDKVDTCLENAQACCERAAHQILRDGDCVPEINKAREHFDEAIVVVEAGLPSLLRKVDRALKKNEVSEELCRQPSLLDVSGKASAFSDRFSLPSDGMLEVDPDEAGSDSDEGDFNIASIRLPPRFNKYQPAVTHDSPAAVTIVH